MIDQLPANVQLLDFESPCSVRVINMFLDRTEHEVREGLAFGTVAVMEEEVIGHILLSIRPIAPMLLGGSANV